LKNATPYIKKITKDQAIELRKDRKDGMKIKEIQKKYGICKNTALDVIYERRYYE